MAASKVLNKILRDIDTDPSPARVMAHVRRLELVVEKLSGKPLDEILEPTPAPAQTAESPAAPPTNPT